MMIHQIIFTLLQVLQMAKMKYLLEELDVTSANQILLIFGVLQIILEKVQQPMLYKLWKN